MRKLRFLRVNQANIEMTVAAVSLIALCLVSGLLVAISDGLWWCLPLCLSIAAIGVVLLLLFMFGVPRILNRRS
jgi:hypothetical protein